MIVLGLCAFAVIIGMYVRRVHRQLPMIQNAEYVNDCRNKLSLFYSQEKGVFAEKDQYTETVYETMASVMPTHYAYVLGKDGPLAKYDQTLDEHAVGWIPNDNSLSEKDVWEGVKVAAERGVVPGVEGTCPKCEVTILCVGQLDSDGTLDVWSVSTKARKLNGELVEAGIASHDVNDFEE